MDIAKIKELEDKIIGGYIISKAEALELALLDDKELLYGLADRLRIHFMGSSFDTCSIINAKSGKCSEDCKWCSQSKFHNSKIDVYSLIPSSEAVEMAKNNSAKGVGKFSLVTSGRALSHSEIERVCAIYDDIRDSSSIKLCASMGLLNFEQLQKLYNHGVRYYHCNMESAPSFFQTLCSTHSHQDKLETIKLARKAGLEICSGGIIGMGESLEQRIEFAFMLRELEVGSIPLNILNPIKGTQLENTPPLSEEEILVAIAIFRVINPTAYIRFAGGRGALTLEGQRKSFHSGLNGALVGDLLTTVGANDILSDMDMIKTEGFQINN